MLVGAALALPVLQVPTFHEGRWVALLLGLVPLGFNVLVFLYEVALVQPWRCSPGPTYSMAPPSAQSAFVGLTAFAYAYGGHGLSVKPDAGQGATQIWVDDFYECARHPRPGRPPACARARICHCLLWLCSRPA